MMFSLILAAVLTASGTPATAIDSTLVIVNGRPALHNDATSPVVVCSK